MKILIACDKFKGTFSSKEIGEIISKSLKKYSENIETEILEVSDGGDGFVDCLRNKNNYSRWKFMSFNATQKRQVKSKFLYNIYNHSAIIESANSIGLKNINDDEKNILLNNSYGLGYDINRIIEVRHPHTIIIGVGGTATNDLFLGGASCFGYKFLDENKKEIEPIPQNFLKIKQIIPPINLKFKEIEYLIATDVKNPLYGENGATKIFAPQKGASKNEIDFLEKSFIHLSEIIKNDLGIDVSNIPGSGAGGGIGGGIIAFLGGKIISGADFILNNLKFDEIIKDYDLIITGEGSFDNQSIMGKITGNIINRCKNNNKKICVISGKSSTSPLPNNLNIYTLFNNEITIEEAKKLTEERITEICKEILN